MQPFALPLLYASEGVRDCFMKNIYKIINDVNDMVYVGQTKFAIDERLNQHWRDSKREICKNRSLYIAFNEIGFEHFSAILLEKCEDDVADEREVYWVDKYNSFLNGYNDTYGGKGKHQINYQEVVDLYNKYQSIAQISKVLNKSVDEISYILHLNNINVLKGGAVSSKFLRKKVNQYTLNDVLVATYDSVREAERQTGFRNTHISDVCIGKRKTAYGYKWAYD